MERKNRADMKIGDKDRIIQLISENMKPEKVDEAVALTEQVATSFKALHDRLVTFDANLFAYIAHRLGEEDLEELNRKLCYEAYTEGPDAWVNVMKDMTPEERAQFLIESSWRPHGFTDYDVIEDDEKFDLVLHKCTAQGVPGVPLTKEWTTRKAYPWSQNKVGYPYICIHATYLNWIMKEAGIPFYAVPPTYNDDGTPAGDTACHWIAYKKMEYVPTDNPMPPEYKNASK